MVCCPIQHNKCSYKWTIIKMVKKPRKLGVNVFKMSRLDAWMLKRVCEPSHWRANVIGDSKHIFFGLSFCLFVRKNFNLDHEFWMNDDGFHISHVLLVAKPFLWYQHFLSHILNLWGRTAFENFQLGHNFSMV